MGLLELLTGKKAKWKVAIDEGAFVVDVRSAAEYASGHVKGSQNIPLNNLNAKMTALKSKKTIVTCCASGARSGMAAGQLKSNGIIAYNGGSWRSVSAYLSKKQ